MGRKIIDQIARETLSFGRRGLETVRVVVILLAGRRPPAAGRRLPAAGRRPEPESDDRLADLCAAAENFWVAFGPDEGRPDHLRRLGSRAGASVIEGHEDVIDELLRLVLAAPSDVHPGPADPVGPDLP